MLRLKLFLAGPHLCPAVLHFHKLFPTVRTLFFMLGVRGCTLGADNNTHLPAAAASGCLQAWAKLRHFLDTP
eukprot:superscaffoldBa00002688_g15003